MTGTKRILLQPLIGILASVMLICPSSLAQDNVLFETQQLIEVGELPLGISLDDLNGDGLLDLSVSTRLRVILWFGNGDGTFGDAQTVVNERFLSDHVFSDINNDGFLDLVTDNNDAVTVSVRLGNGTGTYSAPLTVSTNGASTLDSRDFNEDGYNDVLVASHRRELWVHLANPDGTLQPPRLASDEGGAFSVIADFNGDGHLDIASPHGGAGVDNEIVGVTLVLGDGTGGFSEPVWSLDQKFQSVRGIVSDDIDEDGVLDLLMTIDGLTRAVHVLHGNGDGTFSIARSKGLQHRPHNGSRLDLNSDGISDFLLSNRITYSLILLHGIGDAEFADEIGYTTGRGPSQTAIGDLNGDGVPDVCVANFLEGTISVLLGNSEGELRAGRDIAVGHQAAASAVGDFNGDGLMDLVVGVSNADNFELLLGRGNLQFEAPMAFETGDASRFLSVHDLDGDGFDDVISSRRFLSVFWGDGVAGFSPRSDLLLDLRAAEVAVGDFNNDQIPDLVTGASSGNLVTILLGLGQRSFAQPFTVATGSDPSSFVLEDFNSDGAQDIATVDVPSGGISILIGDGSGGFTSTHLRVSTSVSGLGSGDLNGDGIADLVVCSFFDSVLELFFGNGDGSFQEGVLIPTSRGPIDVAVHDLDQDGNNDIVAAGFTVDIFLGEGDGNFEEHFTLHTARADHVSIRDLDGDGDVEIITSSGASESLTIFENLLFDGPVPDSREGGTCLIATAAYGTPLAAEVDVLREFRDAYMLDNPFGASFVDTYYRLSPPLALKIARSPFLASMTRLVITPVVKVINATSTRLALFPTSILGSLILLSVGILLRRRKLLRA